MFKFLSTLFSSGDKRKHPVGEGEYTKDMLEEQMQVHEKVLASMTDALEHVTDSGESNSEQYTGRSVADEMNNLVRKNEILSTRNNDIYCDQVTNSRVMLLRLAHLLNSLHQQCDKLDKYLTAEESRTPVGETLPFEYELMSLKLSIIKNEMIPMLTPLFEHFDFNSGTMIGSRQSVQLLIDSEIMTSELYSYDEMIKELSSIEPSTNPFKYESLVRKWTLL